MKTRERQSTEAKPLSDRELEVIMLVGRGMSNRQVANALRISEATVKRHLANVYLKLKVRSRYEAVQQVLGEGLLTVREILASHGRARQGEGALVQEAPRYRCVAQGCGCEVIVVRAPKAPVKRLPIRCHGREMELVALHARTDV
jgi:DNA-binding CsgD family transcriptional regulator